MKTFIMLLGLLTLMVSCGNIEVPEEEEQGSFEVGQRKNLSDAKDITESEVALLKRACEALDFKEGYFRRNYAGKGTLFKFDHQMKDCRATQMSRNTTTLAKVEFINGEMRFEKLARASVIFDDIVLRSQGVLKDFCNKSESDALFDRYIRSGKTAKVLYITQQGKDILISLRTATDYKGEGKFLVETKDQMRLNNVENKFWGTITQRTLVSIANCNNNQKMELRSKLKEIK